MPKPFAGGRVAGCVEKSTTWGAHATALAEAVPPLACLRACRRWSRHSRKDDLRLCRRRRSSGSLTPGEAALSRPRARTPRIRPRQAPAPQWRRDCFAPIGIAPISAVSDSRLLSGRPTRRSRGTPPRGRPPTSSRSRHPDSPLMERVAATGTVGQPGSRSVAAQFDRRAFLLARVADVAGNCACLGVAAIVVVPGIGRAR